MIEQKKKELVDKEEIRQRVVMKIIDRDGQALFDSTLTLKEFSEIFYSIPSVEEEEAMWIFDTIHWICTSCGSGSMYPTRYCSCCGCRMKMEGKE